MTDYTFQDAMTITQTRLTAMGKRALSNVITRSLDYDDQVGSGGTMPYFTTVVAGVQTDRVTLGTERTRFVVTIEQRLYCEELLAGFDGATQQKAYWTYVPTCLQYFEAHRTLQYPTATEGVPYMEDDSSGVGNVRLQIVQGDNGSTPLVIVFTWLLAYDVTIPLKVDCE